MDMSDIQGCHQCLPSVFSSMYGDIKTFCGETAYTVLSTQHLCHACPIFHVLLNIVLHLPIAFGYIRVARSKTSCEKRQHKKTPSKTSPGTARGTAISHTGGHWQV